MQKKHSVFPAPNLQLFSLKTRTFTTNSLCTTELQSQFECKSHATLCSHMWLAFYLLSLAIIFVFREEAPVWTNFAPLSVQIFGSTLFALLSLVPKSSLDVVFKHLHTQRNNSKMAKGNLPPFIRFLKSVWTLKTGEEISWGFVWWW